MWILERVGSHFSCCSTEMLVASHMQTELQRNVTRQQLLLFSNQMDLKLSVWQSNYCVSCCGCFTVTPHCPSLVSWPKDYTFSSLLAAGKSGVWFQLLNMALITGWCMFEKPWVTIVLACSSLCGILGFAKSKAEKTNAWASDKAVVSGCVCSHCNLRSEPALICLCTGNWLLSMRHQRIYCCSGWLCLQPVRLLNCHEDLLSHFDVSVILLI